MTRSAVTNETSQPSPGEPGFAIVRVGEQLLLAAAQRLVSQGLKDRVSAARRLIASAPEHGIDLSTIWVSISAADKDRRVPAVRQACLAVPGSGRTAMIFISEPMPASAGGEPGGPNAARDERVGLLKTVAAHFNTNLKPEVRVLQALPDPSDTWAENALRGAGFVCVGDLEYRRRDMTPIEHKAHWREVDWPPGVRVAALAEFPAAERDAMLLRVLDETYIDTQDCPELCGMRSTSDILASHYATGVFDPSLWFVVFVNGGSGEQPAGCMLLSRVPEQRALELVYVGLSRAARGKGLGIKLMELAIRKAADPRIDAITCAVDCRNTPALKMYERFGFSALGRRRAFVCSVRS